MLDEIYSRQKAKMESSIEHFGRELAGVRTGRASAGLLDGISVDYYGTPTPLSQVATVSTPDALTIAIQPWEASMIPVIEKAISISDLGLNPGNDGSSVRLSIPPLTAERRVELTKHVKKMAEDSKIALRNIRRDTLEGVKKLEKNKDISEDDARKAGDNIQKSLDLYIERVDKLTADKEKEILDK